MSRAQAPRIKHTRRPHLPLSLFSFMLRVVFALHCVARRACRPVTRASRIQKAPRQTNVYVSIGWFFFLLRRAQPHIHIWHALAPIWPFSISASKNGSDGPVLLLLPTSPFSVTFIFPLYSTQSNPDLWHNRRSGRLACRTNQRCINARGKNEGIVDRCENPTRVLQSAFTLN